jgi:hypothetical protein
MAGFFVGFVEVGEFLLELTSVPNEAVRKCLLPSDQAQ